MSCTDPPGIASPVHVELCLSPSSKGTAGSPTLLPLPSPLLNDNSNSCLSFKDFNMFGQSCAKNTHLDQCVRTAARGNCCSLPRQRGQSSLRRAWLNQLLGMWERLCHHIPALCPCQMPVSSLGMSHRAGDADPHPTEHHVHAEPSLRDTRAAPALPAQPCRTNPTASSFQDQLLLTDKGFSTLLDPINSCSSPLPAINHS